MTDSASLLGAYLRDRRTRLDPAAFGLGGGRRRTPGLRREEVAQRANISTTWYTWLEQGRGGAPSAAVLDRIAKGLMLTEREREYMFMLALGRPPEARYQPADGVSPRLQRVLDALNPSPAIIKTAIWDVVGWNRAAAALLIDYGQLPIEDRNILRLMFGRKRTHIVHEDWESIARFVVAAFRADASRAGAAGSQEALALVEEMCRSSAEFERLWHNNEVIAHNEGIKRVIHPIGGLLELEFSSFVVEGRTDLGMIVYNPVSNADEERIQALILAKETDSLPDSAPLKHEP